MLQIGQQFRDYIIEREIGQGGMGVVYLVRHVDPGIAHVQGYRVLKVVLPGKNVDEVYRKRFKKEAQNGIRLSSTHQHPNLVQVYDYMEVNGIQAILMEYIEGLSLVEVRQADMKWLKYTIKQLANALDFMHSQSIIHRDLKPDNIRWHKDRGPIILDLGISKHVNLHEQTTTTQFASPLFSAPEQAGVHPLPITGALDQYSLAMLTYFWLSGRFPWAEGSTSERISFIKNAENQMLPLKQTLPTVSEQTNQVVMRALSLYPNQRYATCTAFAEAFEWSLTADGLSASQKNAQNSRQSVDQTRLVNQVSETRRMSSSSVNETRFMGMDSYSHSVSKQSQSTRAMGTNDFATVEHSSKLSMIPIVLLSASVFVCVFTLAAILVNLFKGEVGTPGAVVKKVERVEVYAEPEPEVEIAELKPQRVVPTKQRAPRTPKATSGTLNVSIGATSDRVSSINVMCGDFRSRSTVRSNKATVTKVPLGTQCKLKFSPGGAIWTGNAGGRSLTCSVRNGNLVSCIGEFSVTILFDKRATLKCGDGQSRDFVGQTTMTFQTRTACRINTEDGERGALTASNSGIIQCSLSDTRIRCK